VQQERFLNEERFMGTARRSRYWLIWLLVLLFPIPFTPWWVGVGCLIIFGCLAYLLAAREKKA